jgi:hypothetical protein
MNEAKHFNTNLVNRLEALHKYEQEECSDDTIKQSFDHSLKSSSRMIVPDNEEIIPQTQLQ